MWEVRPGNRGKRQEKKPGSKTQPGRNGTVKKKIFKYPCGKGKQEYGVLQQGTRAMWWEGSSGNYLWVLHEKIEKDQAKK